jgi:hypothetical protein
MKVVVHNIYEYSSMDEFFLVQHIECLSISMKFVVGIYIYEWMNVVVKYYTSMNESC